MPLVCPDILTILTWAIRLLDNDRSHATKNYIITYNISTRIHRLPLSSSHRHHYHESSTDWISPMFTRSAAFTLNPRILGSTFCIRCFFFFFVFPPLPSLPSDSLRGLAPPPRATTPPVVDCFPGVDEVVFFGTRFHSELWRLSMNSLAKDLASLLSPIYSLIYVWT